MAWLVERVPAPRPCFLHTAAAGHGSAWAFGIRPGGGGRFDTMVFGREADAWRRVDVPVIGRANAAAVVSPEELWVVGDGTSLHHVDGRWREIPLSVPVQLFGVVAFGDDVWAAGYWRRDGVAGRLPYAVHWDGVRWSVTEMPGDRGQVNELVVAKDRVYGVGYVPGGPYVAAWDGDAWHAVDGPPGNGDLHGGTALPDGRLLVVGTSAEAAFAAVLQP